MGPSSSCSSIAWSMVIFTHFLRDILSTIGIRSECFLAKDKVSKDKVSKDKVSKVSKC